MHSKKIKSLITSVSPGSKQNKMCKAILLTLGIILFAGCGPRWEIENPYETVDWESDIKYKANFHTHTTLSDGRLNPHTAVDKYHSLDYEILAITDHNFVSYPWTEFSQFEPSSTSKNRKESDPESMPEDFDFEDRDPAAMGMIDIQGNELSSHHHLGSFFNNHNNTSEIKASLDSIEAKGGISMLYHPGRYDRPVEWYVDLYRQYDHLIGLEVYNQGDRYPEDRLIWDSILAITMPERPVWGFSNDDMHWPDQVGKNWNIMILPKLSHDQVRHGMKNGLSYFIFAPEGHNGAPPPVIESINVNERRGVIEIEATGYDHIEWIFKGNTVFKGTTLKLGELEEIQDEINYVRAKLYGQEETITATQPFGINKP